jgi:hypothetical protein
MDRREEYREDMNSPRSYTDSQWSAPSHFQEHNQIHPVDGYSNSNTSPAVSPPLPYEQEYRQPPPPQSYETYQGGYVKSSFDVRFLLYSRIHQDLFTLLCKLKV